MATATARHESTSRRMSLVLALLTASSFILYIDRGNLSIAAPLLKDELGISPQKLGFLLSAFFWTYAAMQLVAGWLVDRIEVGYVLAAGFLLWSAATAATGFVRLFAGLLLMRLLLGIGESVAYPAYSKILAQHCPEQQRGLANAMIASGSLLGPGLGILVGGMLMASFGWRPFFIGLGAISMLWLPAWLAAMPRSTAPTGTTSSEGGRITIVQFLSLRSAWGACGGHFCSNYLNYFLVTWLPYYLVRERNFSMQSMAKIGALAYFLGVLASTLAGWLSDRWIKSGGDPSRVRKTFAGGGLAGAALFLALAGVGSKNVSAAMLVLVTIFFSVCLSHIFVIAQTLAGPEAAGRWTGMQNFVGNLAGPIAPALTGFAVQRTGNFSAAFAITSSILLFGAFSWWFILPRVEQVDWAAARRNSVDFQNRSWP
jgi:MFS family permease